MAAAVIPLFSPSVPQEREAPSFSLEELRGRLVELSGKGGGAQLTAGFSLVLQAQRWGEPVAFVGSRERGFFPPDVAAAGVDLEGLCVVRAPTLTEVPRAAEQLLRSGAFGLVVLDLGEEPRVPMPLLTRLGGLARKHESAVLFLTEKGGERPSLGSLISLRGEASRRRSDDGFLVEVRVTKDKRRAPGWGFEETCCGPAGLR